jgi:hypothetical protein
VTLAG